MEENLESKNSTIGITFLQKKFSEEPASFAIVTQALFSVHCRDSIQSITGICFNSLKFLKAIGMMKTIKEIIWIR